MMQLRGVEICADHSVSSSPAKAGDPVNIARDLWLLDAPHSRGITAERFVTDWLSLTAQEFTGAHIAVLPVAAVEQHGPHLPVGVDTYIAEAYLKRVRALADDLGVMFLPVQAVGASDEHRAFPGTLTLSPQTAFRAFI